MAEAAIVLCMLSTEQKQKEENAKQKWYITCLVSRNIIVHVDYRTQLHCYY